MGAGCSSTATTAAVATTQAVPSSNGTNGVKGKGVLVAPVSPTGVGAAGRVEGLVAAPAGEPGVLSPTRGKASGEWPPRLTDDVELGEAYPKGASGSRAYRCTVEGREACVKVVQRGGAFPHHAAALENELRALRAAGRHPDLVEVVGFRDGEAELRVFYERCGPSLGELAPLPGREACRAALHVARALSHLHASGVLHRDVNPSNVWQGPGGGGFCLGDLDVAKVSDPPAPLARATSFTGTPNYLAPECFSMGEQPYGSEADVWSLGATAVHALSGALPYGDLTLAELEAAVGRGDRVECTADGPEAEALLALARRCMSVDPAARPTAAEVAIELGDVLLQK